MADEKKEQTDQQRESGEPGGGRGRRDDVGRSGIYPVSSLDQAPADATVRGEAEWGQGERGAKGYDDSGRSGVEAFWDEEKDILAGEGKQQREGQERHREEKKRQ
jgi:hypothetical protein